MDSRHLLPAALLLALGATAAVPVMTDRTRTVVTASNGVTVEVDAVTDEIFRVTTLGRDTDYAASQAAVIMPGDIATGVHRTISPTEITLTSPTTTVVIDKATGQVSFFNPDGELLLAEAGGVDNNSDRKSVLLQGNPGENLYGAGERGHSLRLNGDTIVNYNRQNYGYGEGDARISQMNITMPYLVSDQGYGVLFDDYNSSKMVLGDTLQYSSETPLPLSYYFINGDGTIAGATESFTQLTGRQPLPPFWSLGYITSKYGYHNQQETLGAIDSLKRAGFPVDGIVLDLYWYGIESDMGRLAWDSVQWPDHRAMLRQLKDKGVNLVAISQPYVNKKGAIDNYNYLSSKGMLAKDAQGKTHDVTTWVGEAGMLDVSNPDTRDWLWNRYRDLTEEGIEGWWGDLGEPEVHPATIRHANGQTAEQYHNAYGNEWSRLIYEGFRRDFPDKRLMMLMRGGTAGLQRYSVFPWSTDVSRSWEGLQPQVKIMLNSGLSGLGYMSSDLGGFAVDPANPTDEELYVRWLQMGVFTPTFRTHAQLKPEPYHYPAQLDITRRFVKMRYEWLPYNYSLAYENATKGYPLARPLNFHGENPEEKYANVADEYLWGDNVLVAPVMKKGARQRKVLFPAGEWIDWNNPTLRYRGGTEATVKAPLAQLPLFVRAGSFIPQYMEPIENVKQYNPGILTVKYFPAPEQTSFTLFDDNRLSPTSLEDGTYVLTTFTGEESAEAIHVDIETEGRGYEGMPQVQLFTFEIVGVAKPKGVEASGSYGNLPEFGSVKAIRQYGWCYNASSKTLCVRLPYDYTPLSFTVEK